MILLTFFLGILANFLGYIPPGNINLTVVQLSINRGSKQTNNFIASFCLIELLLTFLIVRGAQWLSHTVKLTLYIDWVMVFLFSIGSSIGAGICLLAYSKFAGFVFKKFTLSNQLINKGIAVLFFTLAAFQLGKLIFLGFK
jgi:threonine/homoserine/homoserine lactone efflux protein